MMEIANANAVTDEVVSIICMKRNNISSLVILIRKDESLRSCQKDRNELKVNKKKEYLASEIMVGL